MTPRVPDLLLERLLAGELPPDRAAEVRRRLEAEPGGLERLAALERSNAEILAALPPERVAREVRARVAEAEVAAAPRRRAPLWLGPVGLAVAAALVLVSLRPDLVAPTIDPVVDDGHRLKGGHGEPALRVYRREGRDVVQLREGDVARDGDALQVGYVAGGWAHGVLLSVDGLGHVTLHHPASVTGDTVLDPAGRTLLDHSFVLDDAPHHETFVLVVDDRKIDVPMVVGVAQELGAGGPFVTRSGRPLQAVSFVVRKEAP